MNALCYIGLILSVLGGLTLDSEGNGYIFSLTCCALGFICLAVYLIYVYRNAKQMEINRFNRMVERERRRGA